MSVQNQLQTRRKQRLDIKMQNIKVFQIELFKFPCVQAIPRWVPPLIHPTLPTFYKRITTPPILIVLIVTPERFCSQSVFVTFHISPLDLTFLSRFFTFYLP